MISEAKAFKVINYELGKLNPEIHRIQMLRARLRDLFFATIESETLERAFSDIVDMTDGIWCMEVVSYNKPRKPGNLLQPRHVEILFEIPANSLSFSAEFQVTQDPRVIQVMRNITDILHAYAFRCSTIQPRLTDEDGLYCLEFTFGE